MNDRVGHVELNFRSAVWKAFLYFAANLLLVSAFSILSLWWCEGGYFIAATKLLEPALSRRTAWYVIFFGAVCFSPIVWFAAFFSVSYFRLKACDVYTRGLTIKMAAFFTALTGISSVATIIVQVFNNDP